VSKESVYELDWWDDRTLSLGDLVAGSSEEMQGDAQIRITCVPAQHNSGRVGIDGGSTLWSGWVVERFVREKGQAHSKASLARDTRRGAIYHAGDTGYRRSAASDVVCPVFKEIGEKFGPFDLSFIPIWRGGTLGFISSWGLRLSETDATSALHGSPADAVAMHQDVKSRNTVGVHFGTFIGSENESYEAVIEFTEACEDRGVRSLEDTGYDENGRAGTIDIGGSVSVEIG